MKWVKNALFMGLSALMLTACGGQTPDSGDNEPSVTINRTGDPIVARVNNTPIYRSDVSRAAQAQGLIGADMDLPTDDPIFLVTVNELIDQRLLSLDAVRADVSQQPEAQRRLAAARERILGNYRVEQYVAEAVNETSIRELYEAQRELAGRGEERRVRQIVLADEATAAEIAQRLNEEEDFEILAADFSTDTATRDRGGELGWVSRGMLPAPLRGTVFGTPLRQRSAPVQAEDGWHIFEVLDTRTPSSRSFEETRDDIARFMTFEAVQDLMTDLRERGEIDRLYEDMDPATPAEADTPPADETTINEPDDDE